MPYGTSVLSPHILFSEYRGPHIFNDASVVPPVDPPKDPPVDPPKDPPKDPNDEFKTRLSALADENKELKRLAKDRTEADKKAEDERLTKLGEHEKLAEQYKGESATERAAREVAEARLKVYEDLAVKQITDSLKGITDEAKRKSAQEMLDGLSVEEQMKRLPNILALVGEPQKGFGNGTPPSQTSTASADQKKARYSELIAKKDPTAQERNERYQLMPEITKLWEDEQARKKAI